jgi:hypothetical protein
MTDLDQYLSAAVGSAIGSARQLGWWRRGLYFVGGVAFAYVAGDYVSTLSGLSTKMAWFCAALFGLTLIESAFALISAVNPSKVGAALTDRAIRIIRKN